MKLALALALAAAKADDCNPNDNTSGCRAPRRPLTMTASRRPRVAVCFAATAKNSNVTNYEQTPMAQLSIPSTKRTAPQARIYVGIDDDDLP